MSDNVEFFDVIYHCRAMRRLRPDPIPDGLIGRILDAAHQAGSGSNAQNRHWIVVRDPARKASIAALNRRWAEGYLNHQRKNLGALPHHEADARARMMDAVAWQMAHMHELPALIVACTEHAEDPRDSYLAGASGAADVWPGVQNLLLAARALGLGAAPTTLSLVDRVAAQEALKLPRRVIPHCLIPIGYPRGRFGPVSRRPVADVVHFDQW